MVNMAYVIRRCRSKGSDPNSAKGQSRYRVYGIPTTHDKGGYDMQQRNATVAFGLHGSSEGHEMLKRNDKYHSIADAVPIPKM